VIRVADHSRPALASRLYLGRVSHQRLRAAAHRFAYRVFSLYLDLDELPQLHRRLHLFSYNRWNILSFQDRDHGARDGMPLRPWIESQMRAARLDGSPGPIRILCFPRLLGYVFNPLSVWFIHGADHRLNAILYEVSNTFGEHHCYLLPVGAAHRPGDVIKQHCRKALHVSPFIGMDARYEFRLHEPDRRLRIGIVERDADGVVMSATHRAAAAELSDRTLVAALVANPLMTMKVIAAIHWQALRLWLKGVQLQRRPMPPPSLVSFGEAATDRTPQAAE